MRMRAVCFKFFLLSAGLLAFAEAQAQPVALVYRGGGACLPNCSDAAAEIPARLGMKVRFVTAKNLNEAIFRDAVLWVQPGGNAVRAQRSIGPKGLELIKRFVAEGGSYVGFCAGAFLTDTYLDYEQSLPGMGLVPGSQEYFELQESKAPVLARVNWGGNIRHIYFNGGGYFDLAGVSDPVEILAHYEGNRDLPVLPATVAVNYGKGRVVVTGTHPEATAAWKSEDGLKDTDGADLDLAEEMVRHALPPGILRD